MRIFFRAKMSRYLIYTVLLIFLQLSKCYKIYFRENIFPTAEMMKGGGGDFPSYI